jgi:hypothetical protein
VQQQIRQDCDAHYYRSRLSRADLLADLDAWKMVDLIPSCTSVAEILRTYYADLAASRREAITRFLKHYGFAGVDGMVKDLPAQLALHRQALAFARVWYLRPGGGNSARGAAAMAMLGSPLEAVLDFVTHKMVRRFVTDLWMLAVKYGVKL